MGISATQYNLFFALYSLPNIVFGVLGGFLSDKFGRRFGILVFTSVAVIGQFLFAMGVSTKSFALAVIGRFVFGMGAETYVSIFIKITI